MSEVHAGRYRVERALGRGAFGEVLRCRDEELGRAVALKILAFQLEVPAIRERFLREARLTARVESPFVVRVYDAGTLGDGRLFIAYEFVPGEDLRAVLEREGVPPEARLRAWAADLAEGLAAIHGAGVLHRDLKCANVLVSEEGGLRICDLGLARPATGATILTETGGFVGTPAYAAPEVLLGAEPTPAADVFSLGCVLYELQYGRPWREAGSMEELAEEIRLPDAPAPAPPRFEGRPLDAFLFRCLRKDPAARLADGSAARVALAEPALPPDEAPAPEPPASWRGAIGVVLAGVLVLLGAALPWSAAPPAEAPDLVSRPGGDGVSTAEGRAAWAEVAAATRRLEDAIRLPVTCPSACVIEEGARLVDPVIVPKARRVVEALEVARRLHPVDDEALLRAVGVLHSLVYRLDFLDLALEQQAFEKTLIRGVGSDGVDLVVLVSARLEELREQVGRPFLARVDPGVLDPLFWSAFRARLLREFRLEASPEDLRAMVASLREPPGQWDRYVCECFRPVLVAAGTDPEIEDAFLVAYVEEMATRENRMEAGASGELLRAVASVLRQRGPSYRALEAVFRDHVLRFARRGPGEHEEIRYHLPRVRGEIRRGIEISPWVAWIEDLMAFIEGQIPEAPEEG